MRPGRFDRQVVIDLPDLEGRDALKVHAKNIKLLEEVELKSLARATAGFSGADLANLLNEGALIAARRSKDVEPIDLDDASEKNIFFGRERRRVMDEVKDRKIIAYHEAGHAIVQAKIDDLLITNSQGNYHTPVVKALEVPCSPQERYLESQQTKSA